MRLKEAELLAREFIKVIHPTVKRVTITGSIRRKLPEVHDIDLVAIKSNEDWVSAALSKGALIEKYGGTYAYVTFHGQQINILFTTEQGWGASVLWSTGSRGHNIGLASKARLKGYKLNQFGLWQDEKYVCGRTEQEIAKVIDWLWTPPELR